jgi:hypothetical protein
MTTLKWDHAVQFVNQPDERLQRLPGRGSTRLPVGVTLAGEPGMRSVISGLPTSSFSPFTIMLSWLRRRPIFALP